MKTEELKEWEALYNQYKNGYHLSKHDWQALGRLNHLVMEASHEIHNKNMMGFVPEVQPLRINKALFCPSCANEELMGDGQNRLECGVCGYTIHETLLTV